MEIWKPVKWLEWVEVSSLWRVRKILTQYSRRDGYITVTISDWKTFSRQIRVSRLVASWFHGLDINNVDLFACHKDDNPSNNNEDNIYVWSHEDNMKDKYNKWRCQWPCKLTQESVIEIRKKRKEWYTLKNIAKEYWVDPSTIWKVCSWITW